MYMSVCRNDGSDMGPGYVHDSLSPVRSSAVMRRTPKNRQTTEKSSTMMLKIKAGSGMLCGPEPSQVTAMIVDTVVYSNTRADGSRIHQVAGIDEKMYETRREHRKGKNLHVDSRLGPTSISCVSEHRFVPVEVVSVTSRLLYGNLRHQTAS